MKVVWKTDVGRMRSSNQDYVLIGGGLFGVADGMGGHRGGNVASALCCSTLLKCLESMRPDEKALKYGIGEANSAVFEKASQDEDLQGMGTTLTVIWDAGERVILGHVGDSRAYLYRDGCLKQVTEDHSLVWEMMKRGSITPEEARIHPYRNMITKAVGTDPEVAPDIRTVKVVPGDLWLICSDGLTEYLTDRHLEEILELSSPEEAADRMLEEALEAGGKDNISLIIAEVTP
ncbi:MAG: Stp1/IreP family PP2C-type Ser/Thr phosphatase [Clostridia bacterium]|nr:Stp1/IreP family PP2C-type Ser/Thr phosphatase [Clostridia bacterium]